MSCSGPGLLAFVRSTRRAFPSVRTVAAMRLSSRLQSRGGGSVSLPSLDPEKRLTLFFVFGSVQLPSTSLHRCGRWRTKLRPAMAGCRFSSLIRSLLRHCHEAHGDLDSASRSSGFRFNLLAAPSHPYGQWHYSGFRPRLRRRVRDGFSPSSLLGPKGTLELAIQQMSEKVNEIKSRNRTASKIS